MFCSCNAKKHNTFQPDSNIIVFECFSLAKYKAFIKINNKNYIPEKYIFCSHF